jgi:hypothetical protein
MEQKDWERQRKGILNGWKYQLPVRETIIQEPLGAWTFAVTMRGERYIAHVVVHSFDYYERRLHLRRDERPINLLICGEHTTCVPLHVEVIFHFPMSYLPYQLPETYTPAKQGTVLGKQVVLGQLLSEVIEPDSALAGCARSTRYAYLARLKQLRTPSPGRNPIL